VSRRILEPPGLLAVGLLGCLGGAEPESGGTREPPRICPAPAAGDGFPLASVDDVAFARARVEPDLVLLAAVEATVEAAASDVGCPAQVAPSGLYSGACSAGGVESSGSLYTGLTSGQWGIVFDSFTFSSPGRDGFSWSANGVFGGTSGEPEFVAQLAYEYWSPGEASGSAGQVVDARGAREDARTAWWRGTLRREATAGAFCFSSSADGEGTVETLLGAGSAVLRWPGDPLSGCAALELDGSSLGEWCPY